MKGEPSQERTHYSHNIILKLHAIQITNNFHRGVAGNRNRATRQPSHWSQWVYLNEHSDLNETFAYVYFFCTPSICNAGNKSGRRSPGSVYAEKFNLRNIREPNGPIGNRNFG